MKAGNFHEGVEYADIEALVEYTKMSQSIKKVGANSKKRYIKAPKQMNCEVELPVDSLNKLQEGYAEKFQIALKATGKTLAQMSDDEKKTFFKHVDSIHTTNSGE
jgi:hypothetical protein